MAETRHVVLSQLATDQIGNIYEEFLKSGAKGTAEALMNDFLDVVFGEVPQFPKEFPRIKNFPRYKYGDYRLAHLYGGYCVIFQVFKKKVLILLVLHEDELPD